MNMTIVDDWQKCMKEISYIPVRKDETPQHFSRRWIAYYRDRIARFNTRVEKIINKHRTDKFKSGKQSLIAADTILSKTKNTIKTN